MFEKAGRRLAARAWVLVVLLLAASATTWGQDPIRWALTDYPPAHTATGDGQYSGYLYEIVVEAFENRLGIPVEVTVLPWSRCQRLVETGEYDMFLTVPTAERREYAVPTRTPVWVKQRIVYTYEGHEKMDEIRSIRSIEDIRNGGFTVVSYVGNGWVEDYVEKKGVRVIYSPTVDTMFKMLDRKRADLVVEESVIAESNIRRLGLDEGIAATEGSVMGVGFHILIGKRSEFLPVMDRLDDAIDGMWADGTIPGILERYGLEPSLIRRPAPSG